jgi:hypothetical protein
MKSRVVYLKGRMSPALPISILLAAFLLALAIMLSCVRNEIFSDMLKNYLGI